jgi:hypothetical protein
MIEVGSYLKQAYSAFIEEEDHKFLCTLKMCAAFNYRWLYLPRRSDDPFLVLIDIPMAKLFLRLRHQRPVLLLQIISCSKYDFLTTYKQLFFLWKALFLGDDDGIHEVNWIRSTLSCTLEEKIKIEMVGCSGEW